MGIWWWGPQGHSYLSLIPSPLHYRRVSKTVFIMPLSCFRWLPTLLEIKKLSPLICLITPPQSAPSSSRLVIHHFLPFSLRLPKLNFLDIICSFPVPVFMYIISSVWDMSPLTLFPKNPWPTPPFTSFPLGSFLDITESGVGPLNIGSATY